jgi:formylglycine-generating enzyme required for sulfatase activity
MVFVEGLYCPFIAHRCDTYLGHDPEATALAEAPEETRRCARYRDDLICEGRPAQLSYCIDRYEYPNQVGVSPATMVSYSEAKDACQVEGKRLCEAEEWFFACEGARTWPYPTGIVRDAAACNIDRRTPRPNEEALAEPRDVSVEMGRLDQRAASGSMRGCVSPFGIYDSSGNVAEWVHNREESDGARATALAGGSWAREPATCRRLDASHGASFRAPTSGFRCCSDPLDGRKARRMLPAGSKLPRRRKLLE